MSSLAARQAVSQSRWIASSARVIVLGLALCATPLTVFGQIAAELSVLSPEEAFPSLGEPSFTLAQHEDSREARRDLLSAERSPFETHPEAAFEADPARESTGEEKIAEWTPQVTAAAIAPEERPSTGLAPLELASTGLASTGLASTMRTILLVGLLGLIPAVLVMTTCFARFAIVFGLLRQGLGAQQWLPNQILFALSLFLTLFVMAPVWTAAYEAGIKPYLQQTQQTPEAQQQALEEALTASIQPVRAFMSTQIAATGNEAGIDMLLSYQVASGQRAEAPAYYEEVPLSVLLPAYLLSELKTAFVIGFQVVLPFLIIDLVVASVVTGMGLMLLPPALVSLPFKLLLFVLIDGWTLTVEILLTSLPPG